MSAKREVEVLLKGVAEDRKVRIDHYVRTLQKLKKAGVIRDRGYQVSHPFEHARTTCKSDWSR